MHHVDLVELAPGMGTAGRLIYMVAVEMMKARIGVCLQGSGEVLQMLAGMFTLAIRRVGEPDSGSSLFVCRTVIAHVGPESTGLGLAVARCKHRHGGVVGVQLAASKHVLADRVHEWAEQIAGCPNPAGQCGARDIHALTGVNLRLPIQGQVVSELGNDDVGQKTGPGEAALDGTRWRRCFNHSIATRASELRPHMSNHAEAVRNILQLFGNILTELPQLRAAIGTAIPCWSMRDHFALEMFCKWLAFRTRLRFVARRNAVGYSFAFGLCGLFFLQLKLQLFKLEDDLLALGAEHPVPHLLDQQLQVLDPCAA